jgi:inosine/xanthosine triphosphatase
VQGVKSDAAVINVNEMTIVIASHNPAKIRAVEDAFATQFPGVRMKFLPVRVESGVSEQPVSDEETRQGAQNRAINAAKHHPRADFSVGLEGGVEAIGDQLMTIAWMAVLGKGSDLSMARTVSLPLPPAVKELMDAGLELGDANDRVFSTVNSKHEGGAFGLLTGGRYTREGVYTQALVIALVPFVNKLYPFTN